MSAAASPAPSVSPRIPGVDAARAIAVAAMVLGHTADGLLSDAARLLPAVQTYWQFRGLTAPLFLFVSGWAVIASMSRSDLTGWAFLRARLGRVALLLGIGYALRFPGWHLSGLFRLEPEVVRHFVGFDALHCIAISLLAGALLLAFARSFWAKAAVVAAVAIVVPLASGFLVQALSSANLPVMLRSALVADAQSPFAILPWIAYFFAGATAGHLITKLPAQWARAAALAGAGALFVGGAWWMGLSNLPPTSPVLYSWRVGQVLLIAALAMLLPTVLASRLAPLGRSSLVVYVFHLPIVYGWSTFPGLNARIGRSLSVAEVAALGLVLLVAGVGASEVIRRVKARLRARRPAPAPVAVGETQSV